MVSSRLPLIGLAALTLMSTLAACQQPSPAPTTEPAPAPRAKGKGKGKGKGKIPRAPSPVAQAQAAEPASAPITIVYAANFDAQSPCHKGDQSGCDLYQASYDLDQHKVLSSTRLTSTASAGEWFPTLDRTGSYVLYEQRQGRRGSVAVLDIGRGSSEVLYPGRYPDFSHTDDHFVFNNEQRQVVQGSYSAGAGGFTATGTSVLTQGRDPQYFPDGEQVMYHVQPQGESTRTAFSSVSGGSRTDWSPANRCAHASVGYSGAIGLCGAGSTFHVRRLEDGAWSAAQELGPPRTKTELGSHYSGCSVVSYAYGEFCGDDDHVAATVTCKSGPDVSFANLFLVNVSSGQRIDLHSQLQAAHGVSGKDTATIACSPK